MARSGSGAAARWARAGRRALEALDRRPALRLPVGPPIPWRYGLLALAALVLLTAALARPGAAGAPARGPSAVPAAVGGTLDARDSRAAPPTPSLGVAEPPGLGFDLADLALKLALVVALAYGSLAALKRLGVGGAVPAAGVLPPGETLRLVASLTLAPNRTLHVVRAPGAKLLLVGATPGQITLIADLGERPDLAGDEAPASFLQLLTGKLAATRG